MATKTAQHKAGQKLSPEELSALATVHGPVREVKLKIINEPEKPAFFYLKKPDRSVISFATREFVQHKRIESGDIIYSNLCVSTDPRIEADDEIKCSALLACNGHIDLDAGELGNYTGVTQ